jgi:hypothetical protein
MRRLLSVGKVIDLHFVAQKMLTTCSTRLNSLVRKQQRNSRLTNGKGLVMRMILLWALGVPFSLLILLKVFGLI